MESSLSISGKKIIIAEDEELNYIFLDTILQRTGATILHARDGAQVVELVELHPDVSMILMDIKMPVMDGYTASRKVKEINPEIKIIAQTAYALGEDENRCYDAGCDDYLTKPINKTILFSMIERHLSDAI